MIPEGLRLGRAPRVRPGSGTPAPANRGGHLHAQAIRIPLACIATMAIAVSACGVPPARRAPLIDTPTHLIAAMTQPRLVVSQGGSVTVGVERFPVTLNPHTTAGNTAATRMVASLIWPQVFEVAPGTGPELDTNVMSSAEAISTNPLTVVYKISPKAVWSDGVHVNAADFIYAWHCERGGAVGTGGQPDSVVSTLGYRDIASVTGSAAGSVVTVVFKSPFADWESLFSSLLPAHIAAGVGWNHAFTSGSAEPVVSAGPFQVTSWDPGKKLVLTRNPLWWGPPPILRKIVILREATPDAMAAALRSRVVQVAYTRAFDASLLASATGVPWLQSRVSRGTAIVQLAFNLQDPKLSSVYIRSGIAHYVRRSALVSTVVDPLAPSVVEDGNHLFANVQAGYADNASGYGHADPSRAQRDLLRGGLIMSPGGLWTSAGAPFVVGMTWAADDPWTSSVARFLIGQLSAMGITVEPAPVANRRTLGTVMAQGNYELAIVATPSTTYPTQMENIYTPLGGGTGTGAGTGRGTGTGTGAGTGAGTSRGTGTSTSPSSSAGVISDLGGFDDPSVNALFAQASRELSPVRSGPVYQEIDQILWKNMVSLPLFAEPTLTVTENTVQGPSADTGAPGLMWNAESWQVLVPEIAHGGSVHAIGKLPDTR